MYSRSRSGTAEEQYRSNLPPVYSGSRFRRGIQEEIPAEDTRRNPPRGAEEKAVFLPSAEEKDPPPLPIPAKESEENRAEASVAASGKEEGFLHSFGQEEWLLIALLLLLSAEHERAMDMIVILLILLGVQ